MPLICPKCGEDLTGHAAREIGKHGKEAARTALTKKQRVARAKKAGKANKGVMRSPEDRLRKSEAMKAWWARKKGGVRGEVGEC